jgi:hypothetical protein
MNLEIEKQRRFPGTEDRLVSMLETLDHLTVTVVAVPMRAPRGNGLTPGDRTEFLAGSGSGDDLAYATWEDAEWQ